MESTFAIKAVTFLYLIFNSARVLSYLPQIWTVFKEKSPVLAISLMTWGFWVGANFTTGLYSTVVVPDFFLALMSYGNAFCCAVVFGMVTYKRFKYHHWTRSNILGLNNSQYQEPQWNVDGQESFFTSDPNNNPEHEINPENSNTSLEKSLNEHSITEDVTQVTPEIKELNEENKLLLEKEEKLEIIENQTTESTAIEASSLESKDINTIEIGEAKEVSLENEVSTNLNNIESFDKNEVNDDSVKVIPAQEILVEKEITIKPKGKRTSKPKESKPKAPRKSRKKELPPEEKIQEPVTE